MGQSPLYVTKSSDEGHDRKRWSLPLTSAKSVVRDEVLRRGASWCPIVAKSVVRDKVLRAGAVPNRRSPLYVTKSSDEGHHGARAWPSPLYVTKSSEQGQCQIGEVRCT
jgi:hypothetical protein